MCFGTPWKFESFSVARWGGSCCGSMIRTLCSMFSIHFGGGAPAYFRGVTMFVSVVVYGADDVDR